MKILVYILLIFTVIATAVISIKQPPMHSRIMVYDSQYSIVDNNKSQVEQKIEAKELPTMPQENTLAKVQTVFEETPTVITSEQSKKVQTPKKVVSANENKVQTKNIPSQVKTEKQSVNKNTSTPQIKTETKTAPQKQVAEQKSQTTVSPAKTVTPSAPKVLTEQEETIAWNIWRSNLQNQLMKDSKLPVLPIGTIFKVSFDVDKSGRISNIQTWSTNPKYTPYAIEFVAPVIRSYQGKSIVEFPNGSKRTMTTFNGGWKISESQKYSTPNDYNDYEKVKM